MAENIQLNKTVFNKPQYKKVINTSFTQLGVKSIQEQIDNQPTVDEFFDLYNKLFYEIPTEGEVNSHEYLIKKSSEYINFDEINEQILMLQKEISELRVELLNTQKELANKIINE
jgi:uncharacterized small protein (DUF1192 family)